MTDVLTDAHVFGLACWVGAAHPMPRAHRHDDIEVNVVVEGRLDYLFGGRRVAIPAGATSVFWAALPHQVVGTAAGSSARWLTVPLDTVLRWRLAEPVITQLLSGAPLITPHLGPASLSSDEASGADPAAPGQLPETRQRFLAWRGDLSSADPQLEQIALLEMEAYLQRVLRVARPVGEPVEAAGASTVLARSRAAAMATYVATHFRDPVSVDSVAASVHLTPHYAMQVFKDGVGSTIGGYLAQCRLAEAQRLLITTQLTVATIAHAAGFASSSRLYAACAEAGLPAPAAYRRIQQHAAGWPRAPRSD